MKKRIFLTLLAASVLIFIFAVSVSAVELIKSSSDEFGKVNVVDGLTSASSDKTARVVLENADGTYSTFYTYYIYPTFNWRKDMTTVNFKQLNDALGTSYTYNSVIRLEALYDFEYHELKAEMYQSLKELHFPENSKITEIRRWYSNVGVLEKINISASVTKLNQNAFRDCTGLKEVTFDEGSSLETITAEAFRGCTSLEEISLPDSVTSVGSSAFWGCTSLRTIRYGANLETFASRATSHTTVFYISKTTMRDFTGTMDSNYFGDSYTPKAATIFFTGNYDEALAFRAKATHKDAYNGTGGLSNAEIVEWNSQNPDSYYISETSWTIVYGYNACDAFYNGQHEDDGNPCIVICGKCGANGIAEKNPVHKEKVTTTYENWAKGTIVTICENDGCKHEITEDAPALFKLDGFSTPTEYGKKGLALGFEVNEEALNAYKATGKTISFGAYVVGYENIIKDNVTDMYNYEKAIKADVTTEGVSYFAMKVTGFEKGGNNDTKLCLGAYVIENGAVSYIQLGKAEEGNSFLYTTYNLAYANSINK